MLCLGDSEPVKMFERTANLTNNQIINYRCDPSEKWLVLIGIAPGAPEVGLTLFIVFCHCWYIKGHIMGAVLSLITLHCTNYFLSTYDGRCIIGFIAEVK